MHLKIQRLLPGLMVYAVVTQVWAAEQLTKPMLGLSVAAAEMRFDGFSNDHLLVPVYRLGVVHQSSRVHAEWSFHEWQDAETVVIRASYDHLFDLSEQTAFFVGFHAALADFKLAVEHQQPVHETGPGLGLQAGLIRKLAAGWQLEAGGRAARYTVESDSVLKGRVAIDSLVEGYLGLLFVY